MAAGEGKRMRPLTLERPKPLIEVAGRPILEHILDALPREVDEVILIVGYKGQMIRDHFGETYNGRAIRYVFQWMPAGTAHALSVAEPVLRDEPFFLLNADDLHGSEALTKMLDYPLALLAVTHPEPSRFGVIALNHDGTLAHIVEKPENPPTNLISTGGMLIDKRIFQYEAPRHASGEYYLTDPLSLLAKEHPMMVIEQDFWISIGYPEDIPLAEEKLRMLDLDNDRKDNISNI